MTEGDKWKLYVPWDLAHGKQGKPPKIPPVSPLVFEIEVHKDKVRNGGKIAKEAQKMLKLALAATNGFRNSKWETTTLVYVNPTSLFSFFYLSNQRYCGVHTIYNDSKHTMSEITSLSSESQCRTPRRRRRAASGNTQPTQVKQADWPRLGPLRTLRGHTSAPGFAGSSARRGHASTDSGLA